MLFSGSWQWFIYGGIQLPLVFMALVTGNTGQRNDYQHNDHIRYDEPGLIARASGAQGQN